MTDRQALTRHAWIDATAGVAGDMLLGAALDAGASLEVVQAAVDAVIPGAVQLDVTDVIRGGQRGTKLSVTVTADDQPHRTWATIKTMLAQAELDEQVRDWAHQAFLALARAEAHVHGTDVDDVHFHEVGAFDSIADVVGFCAALHDLGVTHVTASPIAPGAGRIRAAHGDIPVPVPAVAQLLIGWQTSPVPGGGEAHSHHHHSHHHHGDEHHHHGDEHHNHHQHDHGHHHHDQPAPTSTPGQVGELATPTGVALIRALAGTCEPLPAITVTSVGVGAGGKDFPSHPNVVRLLVGEPAAPDSSDLDHDQLVELQANIDDLDPRLWPGVLEHLLSAGARDAWLTPIVMKKGRPAFTLHALADVHDRTGVIEAMLSATSTLGVREHRVDRTMLQRQWRTVEVCGQPCRVKIGLRGAQIVHAAAEFEDLAQIAASTGRTEYEVGTLAIGALVAAGLVAGNTIDDESERHEQR